MTLSTNTVGQTSKKQEPQQTVAVRSMSSSTTEQWAEEPDEGIAQFFLLSYYIIFCINNIFFH